MRYFRHFSDASSSLTIQKILDEMGLEGYAQYFLLLELLNSKFDGSCTKIAVHSDEISAKVRIKFSKKLETFVQKLANFSVLSFQLSGKVYEIDCPILFELMDKDSKYNRKKVAKPSQDAIPDIDTDLKEDLNKEEDKKINNKKSDEILYPVPFENNLAQEVDFAKIADLFNRTLAGKGKIEPVPFFYCPSKHLEDLKEILSKPEFKKMEFWEKYFIKASQSKYLIGKVNNFSVGLLWLIKFENAYKVLSGQYDNAIASTGHEIPDEMREAMAQRAREYDEQQAQKAGA